MAEHLRAVTLRGLALRQITIFLRRKAQKGLFMEEKAKVTAAPTIAEQCGIKYKEVDGLFYPILGESDPRSYASLGKYGHRYLRVLMENDRYLYNKYFMQGVLFDKAAEYENYAWQLYDTVLQGISKVRGIALDTLEEKGFQVTFHENMQAAMQEIGKSFGFFEYTKIGLPILITGILFFALIGYKLLPDTKPSGDSVYGEQKDYSDVPKWKQWLSLIILILTLIGMIFEEKIGIKLCVVGCIGALLLVVTGVISEKQALKSIDLKTIFLFGGTLSLASALQKSGAGELLANKVISFLGDNPSPYLLTFVVFILCCVLTNFMSNTATTALMVPICLSISEAIGADPSAVLMACVIGGSCAYATPIGMPANTMVIGAGGYTFKDYAKSGIPLIIVSTIVSMILLPILYPFFP